MGLLAEYEVGSSELALGPTMEALPGAEIHVDSVYALDPDRPIGFYWIEADDREDLEAALERDRTVESFERVETANGATLYRLVSSEETVVPTYREWVSLGGQLLRCRGSAERWDVVMRFPDRERFGEYHSLLADENVEFELHRLSDGAAPDREITDPLTDRQREALEIAYEAGFFDVPRRATLSELAAELEISDQAVSERLRRGQTRLLEEYLR